jgi:membrane associated rhomboid family serine protease
VAPPSAVQPKPLVIPLRDTIPSARVPVVNYAIIALNVVVFLYEVSLGRHLEAFILAWGLVPRDFTLPTLVTSMFLHGSWMHLLGNMLYLYIFGDNVEDRLGHARYAFFYMLCGMAAGATQALINPASGVPVVGASGAIAGVSGAYFLFFPRARVVTLVPIFFFLQVIEVPAVFFLLIWFVWQLLSGVATIGGGASGVEGGVAFWAHIGGFLAGMLFGTVLRFRAPPPPRWV